jgi:hypothetical protein
VAQLDRRSLAGSVILEREHPLTAHGQVHGKPVAIPAIPTALIANDHDGFSLVLLVRDPDFAEASFLQDWGDPFAQELFEQFQGSVPLRIFPEGVGWVYWSVLATLVDLAFAVRQSADRLLRV